MIRALLTFTISLSLHTVPTHALPLMASNGSDATSDDACKVVFDTCQYYFYPSLFELMERDGGYAQPKGFLSAQDVIRVASTINLPKNNQSNTRLKKGTRLPFYSRKSIIPPENSAYTNGDPSWIAVISRSFRWSS